MSTDPEKEHFRIVRGLILSALIHEHPKAVDVHVVLRVLDDMEHTISAHELDHHLVYLQEKGYVELMNPKGKGYNIKMVKITAKGTDLHDRFIEDPGVFVEP